jgi:hypothetical protein
MEISTRWPASPVKSKDRSARGNQTCPLMRRGLLRSTLVNWATSIRQAQGSRAGDLRATLCACSVIRFYLQKHRGTRTPEGQPYSCNASRRGRKMRFKVVIAVLCALTILSSVYAFRQRQWALKLRDQLAEANKDDVKLMNILGAAEKETICRKFREHGENRIADWITRQYLVTQEGDETLISQEAK